ncbi:MAG TPA: ATP-binding protein, partial [Pyrinomonadaceae bacterium]|nr:ATP-binding protein [Pyrinomonadaceae bacterium]
MSKGKLIVFSGPPCSGKSTLAERLSRELKSAHLQMDEIRTRLIPDSDHREEHRRIAYKAMHLAAELLLEHDRDVIVDATYRQRRHREELEQIAKRVESPLFLIQCVISQEVAALRFSQRGERHPAVDLNERRVAQLASA